MADTASIDVGIVYRVFLLKAAFGTQDAHVFRAGQAEPEATLDDGSPLGPSRALKSSRAVLRIATERAVRAVRVRAAIGAAPDSFVRAA